jgi:thiol-disulfide isomerase/thioredoxin
MRPIITRGASAASPASTPSAQLRRAMLALVVGVALAALLAIHFGLGGSSERAGWGSERIVPFRVRTLAGRMISVPAAGRPGVLLFAASTCASCLPAARALSAVKAKLGSRIDALMVDVDAREAPSYLRAWASVVHPSYPVAVAGNGRLALAYKIEGLGMTIVYNARGRILARATDPTERQLEAALRQAGVST